MKIIKPSFQIIEQAYTPDLWIPMFKHIELCGRVCYKSEDKITIDSAANFFNNLTKNGHLSVLEHGTVYLHIENNFNNEETLCKYSRNPYSKVNFHQMEGYVTTNNRVFFENKCFKDFDFMCEPTKYHHKRITVKFICSRAIAQELTRHRNFSHSMESQRYCNYSKDKFDNQITFIEPIWFDDNVLHRDHFLKAMDIAETEYFNLLSHGQRAEQARDVLPNATKTEVIMTGFVDDWKRFFEVRTTKACHPEMLRLTIPLKETFIKNNLI
jgi:thymidylate synthase (FAD)